MKKDSLKPRNKNYVYTIPNYVTLFRFLLIPFILYLIFKNHTLYAVLLLILSGILDKVDGVIARKLNQSSYYGGMFDAFTDTVLFFTTLFFTFLTNHITSLFLVLLLLPKVITFLISTFFYKGEYKPTIYSRCSSLVFYFLIPAILLDFPSILNRILLIIIYILSAIHWINLIYQKFNR